MDSHRVQILVEAAGKRHCSFSLGTESLEELSPAAIESRHWFLNKLITAYQQAQQKIDHSHDGLLGLLNRIVQFLESKVDPEEALLRQMRKAAIVEVVYPPRLKEKWVRRMFRRFIRRRYGYHQRWFVINILLLPLTGAMMVLPGPNIFFGWNAYRVVSHYLAREGGGRVRRGVCEIRFVPEEELAGGTDDRRMVG